MLLSMETRMRRCCKERLEQAREQLSLRMNSGVLRFPMRLLEPQQQNVDQLTGRLFRAVQTEIKAAQGECEIRTQRLLGAWANKQTACRQSLETLAVRLDAMSPLKVLARGYSIAEYRGKPVRRARELAVGEQFTVRFSEGTVLARVEQELEEP